MNSFLATTFEKLASMKQDAINKTIRSRNLREHELFRLS